MKELIGKLKKMFTILCWLWVIGIGVYAIIEKALFGDSWLQVWALILGPVFVLALIWWLLPSKWKEQKPIKEPQAEDDE